MRKILNYRPIVLIAIFLLIGVTIGGILIGNNILLFCVSIITLAMGIFMFVLKKKSIFLIVFLSLFVGIIAITIDFGVSNIAQYNEENVFVSGRVCVLNDNEFVLDSISIDGDKKNGKINVEYNDENIYSIGDEVKLVGVISNNENDIFSFYEMSKFEDHIYYNLNNIEEIRIVGNKLKFNEKVKKNFATYVYKYCHKEEAGIIIGLVFGDKSYLLDTDKTAINGVGMSHILAVSGLHIGFLFGIIIYLTKKLRQKPIVSLILIILVWIIYGILTGFPPGIKRAGIMSIVYIIGVLCVRKNDSLTTLSLASIIIILSNPRELFTLGFILSISAVLGIICFAPMIRKKILGNKDSKFARLVANGVAISFSANIFILPISFNVFNNVAIYTILANLIILPFVSMGYVMVIIVALLTIISKPLGVLYLVAQVPITLLRIIANGVYQLPFAVISVYSMSFASISYLIGCFAVTPYFMIEKKKKKKIFVIFMTISILLYFLAIIF
ncbi:MAG: ComEC/Rec2 family competence protein [Clostridia bacterium]